MQQRNFGKEILIMKYQTPVAQLFYVRADVLTTSGIPEEIAQAEYGLGKSKSLEQLIGNND